MSEREIAVLDRLAEIVPQLDEKGQERLGYICEGMAIALESAKGGDDDADHRDDDAAAGV